MAPCKLDDGVHETIYLRAHHFDGKARGVLDEGVLARSDAGCRLGWSWWSFRGYALAGQAGAYVVGFDAEALGVRRRPSLACATTRQPLWRLALYV